MDKDVSEQVNRALERQKASISRSNLPEVEKYCLGRGGSNFTARAERLRKTLEAQELALDLNKGLSSGAGGNP